MTFQPVVPVGGYAGWVFLNQTLETQKEAHAAGLLSDTEHFEQTIGKVRTVDDLMADRRLLSVALGAFGLDEDINNTFFIRKVLAEGTSDPEAFANKLSDKTYLKIAEAFGFGEGVPPRTTLSGFGQEIVAAFRERQFEIDVGAQNDDFRLALAAQRDVPDLAANDLSEDAKWFTVMGSAPLRAVFETALGLPSSVGTLDIDEQLDMFKEKAEARFGSASVTQFADPEKLADLTRTFLLRSELAQMTQSLSAGSTALALLTSVTA